MVNRTSDCSGHDNSMNLKIHYQSEILRGATLFLVLIPSFGLSVVHAQAPVTSSPSTSTTAPASTSAAIQTPTDPSSPKPAATDPKKELDIPDAGTTFRLRVNLVQVHVTIRDSSGKPVDGLRKEDFLLYDQGKLQTITTFAVETRQSRRAKAEAAAKTQVEAEQIDQGKQAPVIPDRFVALMVDDTHLTQSDITNVRVEIGKFLDSIAPTDRVAIFTTSGELTHGYTSDKDLLRKTLLGLVPRAKFFSPTSNCPDVSVYEADQIVNYNNPQVLNVDVADTVQCAFNGDPTQLKAAQTLTLSTAQRLLVESDTESQYTYTFMQEVIRSLAARPGERVVVFVSPGFLMTNFQHLDMTGVVDLANHSNVVINVLDGRGLYTPDLMGDITKPMNSNPFTAGQKASYRIEAQTEQSYVLMDLAFGTGGTFFHNSNDLSGGLEILAAAPEVSYVLGFSPLSQKMDGQFHTLKVALTQKNKYTIQARRGYMAPKKFKDANEQAKQEIQDAVLSRDEILDFPLQIQTQYFKAEDSSVHLSVVSRLQIGGVHFRKADGRNWDDLTLATVIFDDNGNFVMGQEKLVTMKLLDATYEKLARSGIVVKSTFDVKPGKYMIRQVVRDSEGSQMAARNGAVDIPN